jgi:uncharacterized protein (TIGR03435 family)
MRHRTAFRKHVRGAIVTVMIFAAIFSSHQGTAQNKSPDLVATWQGTLGADQGQRIVIRITTGAKGEYRAVFYSIDRSGDGVPVSSFSVDGSAVKMSFTMNGGTYSGRLSPDGKSIAGTWSQNSAPVPLTLTRAASGTEWAIPAATAAPAPMDPHADPAFEVATIKPGDPEDHRKFFRFSPDHLEAVNETVDDMITFSYGVHRKQIVDAPEWTASEKLDISAKPDAEGRPSISQWKTMVQKLLADRFKLSFHPAQRELAVYLLAAGPAGAKLTESQGDPNGMPGIGFQRRPGDLAAFNVSMADFLNFMNRNANLDRPIVDRTGLTGRYDFKLSWTPDDAQGGMTGPNAPRPAEEEHSAPSLVTALQEQLGLKLSATKTVAEVYVIDHIEKASQN